MFKLQNYVRSVLIVARGVRKMGTKYYFLLANIFFGYYAIFRAILIIQDLSRVTNFGRILSSANFVNSETTFLTFLH